MLKKNLDLKILNLGKKQFCVVPLSNRIKETKNSRGFNNKIKINKKEEKKEEIIDYENIENDDLTLFYEGQKMEFEDINEEIDDFMDILDDKQKSDNLIEKINPLIKEKIKDSQKEQKSKNKKKQNSKKPTHFLNIPILNAKSFNKKFYAFENLIREINPKFEHYIYRAHPHITLAVLSLTPDQENLIASIIFEIQNNIKKFLNKNSFKKKKCHKFQLNSLGIFAKNDDFSKSNVVYGAITERDWINKLNEMNNYVLKNLSEMGIIDINDIPHVFYDELQGIYKVETFHVTFMKHQGGFDSRDILRKYGDFNFGFFEFDKLSLNKLDKFHTETISLSLI